MAGGTVTLHPSYGPAVTLLTSGPPQRSGGVGGWESSEREGRLPGKWFKGRTDTSMSWDLILDRDHIPVMNGVPLSDFGPVLVGVHMVPANVDLLGERNPTGLQGLGGRLEYLHDMGIPHNGHDEPPTITLTGDVWHRDKTLTWVLDDLSLGDRLFDGMGSLRRQHVTVQLSRFTGFDEIDAVRIKSTRTAKHKKRKRTVVTKQGDTLRAVALRELGEGSRWKDLKKWNKKLLAKVNPDARLRAGLHLRLDTAPGEASHVRGAGPGVRG